MVQDKMPIRISIRFFNRFGLKGRIFHPMSEKRNSEFDPLDMKNYRMDKLNPREKTGFERKMQQVGGPLAIVVFVLLLFVVDIPFLQNIDPALLGKDSTANLKALGPEGFSQANVAMLAIFVTAILLWITEAVPNYLTSLMVIVAIVLTRVTPEKQAYAQLGHPVMWLNILSFILASMLVKTDAAKRFALWFIVRYGKSTTAIFFSFMLINVVLTAFISATTAKAAILLPIFMVVAAIYGAQGGDKRNNFGRNLVLQNLFQINVSAGGFITGSGALLLAVSMIGGAMGWSHDYEYFRWTKAAFPLMVINLLAGYFVGTRIFFRLKKEDKEPQLEGGMELLSQELAAMGKVKAEEVKAVLIFVAVLILWVTDSYHGISKTAVAFLGAIVALMPGIGIVQWKDVDIPWNLMLFSAGAYTLGAGFKTTDLPAIAVNAGFSALGFSESTPFWVLYLILTGLMVFSSLFFQSKTMRALLFVPIAIGTAQSYGHPIMSLAVPVAMLIEHVYALPFNSKPAALLYMTDQYSMVDSAKFGVVMLVIGWVNIIIWGETWMRWLGYTPNGVFGLF